MTGDVVHDLRPDVATNSPMGRTRRSVAWSVLAVLLLWVSLVAPYQPGDVQPAALLRLPLEGLLFVAVTLVLPARARRPAAWFVGVLLAVLFLLKALEIGFLLALDRSFDPLSDAGYAGPAVSLLTDMAGTSGAVFALIGAGLLVLGVLIVLPLAAIRVAAVVSAHPGNARWVVTVLITLWASLALSGMSAGTGPVAAASDARLVLSQADQVIDGIRDEQRFAQALADDPLAEAPAGTVLSELRGKDVLVVFVESYGRFAVEGSSSGPVVDALDEGTRDLRRAGFRARSAYLTSPTFGGTSWLTHSTLQSGLWIDSERRYDRLMASDHTTLTGLFGRAGWRTIMVIPSSEPPWDEGKGLYGFDTMYGSADLGYTGPKFGYAKVPDQYTLEAVGRLELAPEQREPVMAEVDLVSSHTPWTPLPRLVPWHELGDGAIFEGMADEQPSRAELWGDTGKLRSAYADSLVYSLRSLVGFVERYGDDDLVLVVVGDHQPNSLITGQGASHDVPVSIVARDPSVIGRIAEWGWHDGLKPRPDAPVWPMDAFRNRFLEVYSAPEAPVPSASP